MAAFILPLLARAAGGILTRYGLKKVGKAGLRELRATAKGKMKGPTTRKSLRRGIGKARRRQVAGNLFGDSTLAYMIGDSLSSSARIDSFTAKKELRDYVKRNKPSLWREFTRSPYNDIERFLKAKKLR